MVSSGAGRGAFAVLREEKVDVGRSPRPQHLAREVVIDVKSMMMYTVEVGPGVWPDEEITINYGMYGMDLGTSNACFGR